MDLPALINVQRTAFNAALPVPLAVRQDRLTRACRVLIDHADAFCTAMSDDFGHRSREQSMIADIVGSVRTLKHARKHLARWSKPEHRKLDFPLGLLGEERGSNSSPRAWSA